MLGEIGHGGMATVYRARDPRLNREVALKVIHRHLRDSEEVYRRFSSEALAVAKVRHPNIVDVYDVSASDDPERYLVVELIEGRTLRQELQLRSPLPPEVGVAIAIEVCRGLCQAHLSGVIHRDVKPENVLLSTTDLGESHQDAAPARVKLTDFGIAKLLDAQGVTHTGQVLGSPAHMAPEQIEGGAVDGRADVFSVGVMLYEMLSGCLPFAGTNPAQLLKKVLDGNFTPLIECAPQAGQAYSLIVQKALARDLENRYQTIRELLDVLTRALDGMDLEGPRAIVTNYLTDPISYAAELEQKVVQTLIDQGVKQQEEGQVVAAARSLNRALAYRPDDAELLGRVAGLRRKDSRRRTRNAVMRVAAAVVPICALLSGTIFYFLQLDDENLGLSQKSIVPSTEALNLSSEGEGVSSSPAPPAAAEVQAKDLKKTAKKLAPSPNRRGIKRPKNPRPLITRAVRTPVVGPQNAQVKIDGKLSPWFRVHQLALGEHQVEFVPPNTSCCETPQAQTIVVVRGEGPQTIRGVIDYKSAILRFSGAKGYRASCGLGGLLAPGATRTIPMDRSSRRLQCKVYSLTEAGKEQLNVSVILRPGKTSLLQGG